MSIRKTVTLSLTGLGLVAALASAGGPAPENRAAGLNRVCKAGPNGGAACADDSGCPSSSCILVLERGALTAVVTIIVDDDVSRWDQTQSFAQVHAATVLMEVRKDGTHLLAQTYQNLGGADLAELLLNLQGGAFLADTFDPVTEGTLDAAATTPDLLGRFLFQSGDTALANRLRTIAGSSGQPVVIGVPRKLDPAAYDNHLFDTMASVFRVKVKLAFVAP